MIPTKVNNFEVIAAIEVEDYEGNVEWYVVVDRASKFSQRYATWNYQVYKEDKAAFHGFYTDSREEAIENMIVRSGFALAKLSS